MSEFKQVVMSEIAEVFNGKTPSKAEQRNSGSPILKVKDVDEFGCFRGVFNSFVDEEFYQKWQNKCIKQGDVLILNAAHNADYVGSKIYFAKEAVEKTIATGEWLIVRPRRENIDPYFAYSWFCNEEGINQIKNIVKGIHLYPKDVQNIRIRVPPLPTQKKISAILEKADVAREKRRQASRLTEEFLRSTFLEMFGDPIVNPKGWPTKNLGELGKDKDSIVDGPFGSSIDIKVDYVDDGEIPVIRTKNIKPFRFDTEDLKFMRREKFNTVIRSRVVPGDVILSKVGTIGNVCIFPAIYEEAVLSTTGSCKITVNDSIVNNIYLAHYLNLYKPKMLQMASCGVQAFLNMKHVKGFIVPVPPLRLQDEFATLAHKIEALRAKQRESEKELDDLFHSLMQRAFRGELVS